jgi:beta-glucosidase
MFWVLLLAVPVAPCQGSSPWPDGALARARELVGNLTLPEKISLLQGDGVGPWAGTLPAISRLGIPVLALLDGPQGVGDGLRLVTAWPAALSVAASWDSGLMQRWGAAMGLEQFRKGTNIMLGPGTNLARVPWNGRLYEYYSEEPLLASALVAAVVQGVQANNISACVKHFLGNSQESWRGQDDAVIGERALHEMYYPAFRAAARAGAGSFMLGVNKVRGLENSANAETIGLLFADGFLGFLMTDWAGIVVPNASAAAWAGTSVEMPVGYRNL